MSNISNQLLLSSKIYNRLFSGVEASSGILQDVAHKIGRENWEYVWSIINATLPGYVKYPILWHAVDTLYRESKGPECSNANLHQSILSPTDHSKVDF